MSVIKGTNVSSPVVPYTTDDKFPTHYAKYGNGGFMSVRTLDELDNIPQDRREPGMFVYVFEDDKLHKLRDDNVWEIYSTGGGGGGGETNILEKVIINKRDLTVQSLDKSVHVGVGYSNNTLSLTDENTDPASVIWSANITEGSGGLSASDFINIASIKIFPNIDTYTINHQLGTDSVIVQVLDVFDGNKTFSDCVITRFAEDSLHYVRVYFPTTPTNALFLVIIIGHPDATILPEPN